MSKNYTASDIVKRALQLADISNTDFLTHQEMEQYMNDAWVAVLGTMINKGVHVFIKEVSLHGASNTNRTEYKLPDDLWQICSLKTRTGVMITRKAESENESSNTYEIFNDTLRLYGTSSDLILTYWTTPVHVTFPDKTIELEDLLTRYGRDIVATYGNKVVIKNNTGDGQNIYTIVNAVTGELIGQRQEMEDDVLDVILTEDYFVLKKYAIDKEDGATTLEVYDEKGEELLFDLYEDFYQGVYKVPSNSRFNLATDTLLFDINNEQMIVHKEGKIRAIYEIEDDLYLIYDDGLVSQINEEGEEIELTTLDPVPNSYLVSKSGVLLSFVDNKELLTLPDGQLWPLNIPEPKAAIDYGYISKSLKRITSSEQDTVFDFPNDLFVSMIAYQIAILCAAKQNASSEGLVSGYQQAFQTFMNVFDQNGAFTRVVNVY